jgi:hypothetical protein
MFLSLYSRARFSEKSIEIEEVVFLNNAFLTSERNAGLAYRLFLPPMLGRSKQPHRGSVELPL